MDSAWQPFLNHTTWPASETESAWSWRERLRGREATDPEASETISITARSPKAARVEAALLVADGPLPLKKLTAFAALSETAEAATAITELNQAYDRVNSPFRIERLATGYQLLTSPTFAPWLDRLHQRQARLRLSPSAAETLAIIAYRQPLTRAEIEAVRGVASAEMIKQLMDRGLVKIVGEDDSLGRPFLYGTARAFLDQFGLHSLEELPHAHQLKSERQRQAPTIAETDEPEPGGTP